MRTIRPETAATIANDIAEGTATHWRKHQIAAACQYWAMEASRLASELALARSSAKVDDILTRLEDALAQAQARPPLPHIPSPATRCRLKSTPSAPH